MGYCKVRLQEICVKSIIWNDAPDLSWSMHGVTPPRHGVSGVDARCDTALCTLCRAGARGDTAAGTLNRAELCPTRCACRVRGGRR
jgi:hypothetical protein